MNIAWIGVGNLGTPIVKRLMAAGMRPVLFDPRPLTEFDSDIAASAMEAASAADVVFTTLPNDAVLTAVATDILPALKPSAIYCDMSTVSPTASASVAAMAGERAYVRAPVSGSVGHAEQGVLTIIASGPRDAYDRLVPIWEHISSARYLVGDQEEARVMKLMINNLIGSTATLLGESLTLGRKAGLDWNTMLEVIANSAAASPILKLKEAPMAARDFTPAFTTTLMVKDLSLVAEAGAALGCDMPMASQTLALMTEHAANGGADEDYFGVVKLLEQKAGL